MGVGFNPVIKLAKVMIDDKPAIEDSAVRARLANWYVEKGRPEVHRLPDDDGAVARPDSGTGKLHR